MTRTTAKVIHESFKNYTALHAIPRAIRPDQWTGFVIKSVGEFCTRLIISF